MKNQDDNDEKIIGGAIRGLYVFFGVLFFVGGVGVASDAPPLTAALIYIWATFTAVWSIVLCVKNK